MGNVKIYLTLAIVYLTSSVKERANRRCHFFHAKLSEFQGGAENDKLNCFT